MLGLEVDILPLVGLCDFDVPPARLQLLDLLASEVVHLLREVEVQHICDVILQQPGQGLEVAGVYTLDVLQTSHHPQIQAHNAAVNKRRDPQRGLNSSESTADHIFKE